jgi:hypothetical protein
LTEHNISVAQPATDIVLLPAGVIEYMTLVSVSDRQCPANVMPAEAGTHDAPKEYLYKLAWMAACAAMTL